MKVVLNASLGKAQLQKRLAEQIASQAIWVDDADAAIRELPSADALVCPDHFYSAKIADAVRTSAPKLRWIQLLTAGYDHIKQRGAPKQVTVCNAGQAYAPAVAMHAVALLLAVQRRLTDRPRQSKAPRLGSRASRRNSQHPRPSTIAVIGFGPIGREIGRLLRALGARVVAVTRRGLPDAHADEVAAVDRLHDVLARADAIVIAASYDDIDARFDRRARIRPLQEDRGAGQHRARRHRQFARARSRVAKLERSRARVSTSPIPSRCRRTIRCGTHPTSSSRPIAPARAGRSRESGWPISPATICAASRPASRCCMS